MDILVFLALKVISAIEDLESNDEKTMELRDLLKSAHIMVYFKLGLFNLDLHAALPALGHCFLVIQHFCSVFLNVHMQRNAQQNLALQ